MPRLGAAYDLSGTGRWIAQATYGHYAGKYTEPNFQDDTDVGNPGLLTYEYTGPAGQGMDFLPGFDPANYSRLLGGNIPTANVTFADGMHSPVTREFTLALATPFGDRGAAKVSYQWRSVGAFIEDFIDDPSAERQGDRRAQRRHARHASTACPSATAARRCATTRRCSSRPTAGCRAGGPWTATGRCS